MRISPASLEERCMASMLHPQSRTVQDPRHTRPHPACSSRFGSTMDSSSMDTGALPVKVLAAIAGATRRSTGGVAMQLAPRCGPENWTRWGARPPHGLCKSPSPLRNMRARKKRSPLFRWQPEGSRLLGVLCWPYITGAEHSTAGLRNPHSDPFSSGLQSGMAHPSRTDFVALLQRAGWPFA